MKQTLIHLPVIVLLSFVSVLASAAGLSGNPTDGQQFDGIEKIAKHDEERFKSLAQSACGLYSSSGSSFPKHFNQIVEDNMRIYDGVTNPTEKQKVDFLNLNKDKMTCGSEKNKKNYMLVAFDEGAQTALFSKVFMRQYISKDRSARIDVNAVSYTGPEKSPETVLDYMNNILADSSQPKAYHTQVKKLKSFFVKNLGAKTFNQFDEITQTKYIEKSKALTN